MVFKTNYGAFFILYKPKYTCSLFVRSSLFCYLLFLALCLPLPRFKINTIIRSVTKLYVQKKKNQKTEAAKKAL